MESLFNESCEVLREAIGDEIVERLPQSMTNTYLVTRILDEKTFLYIPLMKQVKAQRDRTLEPSPWLEQQQTWQLPATRRYNQSIHPQEFPVTHPGPAPNPWMVELARWPVPYGSIGVVKHYEQFLADSDDNIYTLSGAWGNPFPDLDVLWYFRLSPMQQFGVPWVSVVGAGAIADRLPGIPYDDLSVSQGTWFPVGGCASTNIHLPVPGGYFLRVVAIVVAFQEANPILAAKIAGTIQSETHPEAQKVLRESW